MSKTERFARFDELVEQSDAVQVVLMESWLDDDIKCEAHHFPDGCAECSGNVTHIGSNCLPGERRVCEAAAAYVRRALANRIMCLDCGIPVVDHWRIRPI